MSLYADYIREREGFEVVETEDGFATFKLYENGECYLRDIYVAPEARETGLATEMADRVCEIARASLCHTLIGSVAIDDKFATRNTKVLLAYGMEIYKTSGTVVFFKKRL